MKKYLIVALTALLTFCSFLIGACADELSDLNIKLNAKDSECKAVEAVISELSTNKKTLTDELTVLNEDLMKLQSELETTQQEVDQISKDLDAAQKEEDAQKELFYDRLRVMYENGNEEAVIMILNSDDIMTISKKLEYMRQISEYDRGLFDNAVEVREKIKKNKDELDKKIKEYNKQKEDFDTQIESRSEQIKAIDDQLTENENKLKTLSEEKNKISGDIDKLSYSGRLFAEGEKYLGFPYVWGGSTPETSFDCSGFVCWTYTHSGVYNLPRTTAQGIYNQCKKISREEAKPGDIIFFQGTYSAGEPVTHVGIYAGNNRMLHCGNPIQYTSTSTDYWTNHFYAFGRLGR